MNFNLPQKSVPSTLLIIVGIVLTCLGLVGFVPSSSERILRSLGQLLLAGGVLSLVKPKLSSLWLWPLAFVIASLFFFLPIPQTASMPSTQSSSVPVPIISTLPAQPLPTPLNLSVATSAPTGANFSDCGMLPGLIGRWAGEGDARSSVGENHGTLVGGVTFVPGQTGQGFGLNGSNQYAEIPDAASLDGMSQLTVGAWVKFDTLPSGKWLWVISKAEANAIGTDSYSIWFAGDTMRLQGNVASGAESVTLIVPDEIQVSRFYYVALTYDGVTVKIYLDGLLKASAVMNGNVRDTTYPVFIGRRSSGGGDGRGDPLDGIVDEVEIYNRALSETEIQALFNAGKVGKCTDTTRPTPGDITLNCVTEGLIGQWSGEDDAQDWVGENHGTLYGVTFAPGKLGQAFSFDGMDDFVDIPNNPDHRLDLATNFTLSAWIFNRGPGRNQADRYKDYRIILEKRHLQVNSWSYGLVLLPSDILQGIFAAETGEGVSIESPMVVPRNIWSHIAMIYDGAQLQLYLNGNLVATKATTLVPSINDEPIRIGNWNHLEFGNIQHFNGLIDEVEIYNRALSATEIQSIFTAGNTGKCEPASLSNSTEPAPLIRFSEPFTGTLLNPANWSILDGSGMIALDGGVLSLSRGEHKRLNTRQTFVATPAGVSAKARIHISGDYQKFGFGVNTEEFAPPTAGFYFDTYSRFDSSQGRENAMRLLVIDLPARQKTPVFILNQEISIAWNEFHDLEIVWTPSTVSFYIDGEQKASTPYRFTGNLPVGIWNDGPQLMQVDRVDVSELP